MPTTPRAARTVTDLLTELVRSDATRPRLTWYDDAPGPTQGERIELSARVLVNWVSKAANLLAQDLGVERGDVVALDLPPHWRGVYWALASWSVGAVVSVGRESTTPAPAVLVTSYAQASDLAPAIVAVSLPALARRWAGGPDGAAELAPGAVDEASDLAAHDDRFEPYDAPGPDDDGLARHDQRTTVGELLDRAQALAQGQAWAAGERVAVLCPPGTGGDPDALQDVLMMLLAVWSVDGSAVLVRDADPATIEARLAAERVTSACGPAGTPASRP